ncbi:hypothetical protein Dimus_037849 [Dionaea muscipula]
MKHKARLVVKGYNQRAGVDFDEVFAPVARLETVRLLIAMAAHYKWRIFQMDFKSAFLNGVLKEDVYIHQPPGYVVKGHERQVLKLHKALYGLKQAPRTWNITLDIFLKNYGFARCPHEYALYVKHDGDSVMIICVYVDDILLTGAAVAEIEMFKGALIQHFAMTDLGVMSYYLGIKVEQNSECIFISQQGYISKVLSQFNMVDCNPVSTPIVPGTRLQKKGNGAPVDASLYRSLVGSLRYITCTRPDILFAVGLVCRYMESPTFDHMLACKRILRYLKGTISFGVKYVSADSFGSSLELSGYSDSDWGNDFDSRRSTTGFLFGFGLAPFSWVSKLQPIVTLSSSEAEYVAVAAAVSHCIWLRQLLEELHLVQQQPTEIGVDNQSAIAIAKNPVYHDRSKHIDVRFHFLRDSVANGVVKLVYVKTQDQLADILTKPLPLHVFTRLRSMLGVVDSSLRGAYVSNKLD